MYVYIIGIIILLVVSFNLFILKGKETLNKFFFFLLFTIAFIAFSFDIYDIYKEISLNGIFQIYINILLFCILAFAMLIMDQKWKKHEFAEFKMGKLISITKFIAISNFLITIYFITELSNKSNIPFLELYAKHPYYLEINFVSNSILGNFLKTSFFNIVLIVLLKIKYGNYRHFTFFLILSIITLLAPNQKGILILSILSITHIVLYYKKLNFLKLFKIIGLTFTGVILVFIITYSLYKSAGVEVSILERIYSYLTFPVAGTAFHSRNEILSIFELQSFSGIFNKLNLLERNNIEVHRSMNYIGDIRIGNVGGIFAPFYEDFGFIGPLIFILIIVFFINILEIFRNSYLVDTLFLITISILDMSLFGNYFTNTLFIEILFSFILFFSLYIIKIPTLVFKWKI
jgi:oligosaccharide repeat unit polymerase